MPVGLEETFHGVKVAPDITYTNTFQFPERNTKITKLEGPSNRPLYNYINTKVTFAKPNLAILARPNTRHAYDETKSSINVLIQRGLVKSLQKHQPDVILTPLAYLQRVPTTTPLHPTRPRTYTPHSGRPHTNTPHNYRPHTNVSYGRRPHTNKLFKTLKQEPDKTEHWATPSLKSDSLAVERATAPPSSFSRCSNYT